MNHRQMFKPMLIAAGVLAVLGIAGVPVGAIVLPLILLACPLMMFFMMRGMGHGGGRSHDEHMHDTHDRTGSG